MTDGRCESETLITTRYEVIPTSFTKSCFDANVQAISLSMIPNLCRGHPSTSIPFNITYACRLFVTVRGRMFPITLHVQLLHHYGYYFSNFIGYSS